MSALPSLRVRPVQRLRVQAVLAVSLQLVRGAGKSLPPDGLQELMSERRRLLRELRTGIECPTELGCFEAMQAAVEESDRALLRIMTDERGCTRA
jgi:hypothetical protein